MKRKSTGAPAALQHKSLGVSGVKVLNDTEGIVEAFVAGIGNKDNGKDIIQPGAFIDSLQARNPKCCWSHDWKQTVGKVLDIYEVEPGDPRLPAKMQQAGIGGLYAKVAFNLKTTRGKDAYEDVKFFGDEGEWSIGYDPIVANYSKELDANLLQKIDLYEISPVAFGMNPLTSTVSIKTEFENDDLTVKILGIDDDATSAKIAAAVKSIIEGEEEASAVDAGTDQPEVPTGTKEDEGSAETKEESEAKVKQVRGSYEEQQSNLREALEDLVGDGYWIWVRATFDSNVVYEVSEEYGCNGGMDMESDAEEADEESKEGTWAVSYQVAQDGTYTFGTPVAVELQEIIVAKYALAQAISKGHSLEADQLVKLMSTKIDEKVGRVLSKSNRDKVQAAKEALDAVLSADSKEEDAHILPVPADGKTAGDLETKEEETPISDEKAAIPSHSTKTSDDTWSGSTQWTHLPQEASALKEATAWVDPEGEADKKSSYKFIHHFVDVEGNVGAASTKACSTGIGVLNGGRSGTTIPDADKKGVFNHLVKHLKDSGAEQLPELKAQIEALAKELGIEEEIPDVKAYEIRKNGSQYCVHNQDTGAKMPGGCHSTRADAMNHMRALYANVEDAKKDDEEVSEEKSEDTPVEELSVEITLDEESEETEEKSDASTTEEKSEESTEEIEEPVHEFKALEGVESAPCGECGEIKGSDLHIKEPELVELDILALADLELALAD